MFSIHIFSSKKSQRGSTIVELSIVAVLFFAIFFTIVDLSVYGYVKLTMQNAVREGSRYAITGRTDLDSDGDRTAAILKKISLASNGYLTKVTSIDEIRVEDINGNAVSGFGESGDIVAIHIDCEWPSSSPLISPFLSNGNYHFTVSSAMKNESF